MRVNLDVDGFCALARSLRYTHSRSAKVVGRRYTVVEDVRKGVNILLPSLEVDELMDRLS